MFNELINNQKKNFNNFIESINETELNDFVNILEKFSKNNIFTLGVGKSGNISCHISDILKSISISSFNLNVTNLTHGDFGCISVNDLVIVISKSGNTNEILKIIDNFKCYKILLCNSDNSKISKKVEKTFVIPLESECDLSYNLIPSNSITNTIIYFNISFNLLLEKLSLPINNYKENHPSGDIGFKTKKIRDFINKDFTRCNNYFLDNNEIIKLLMSSKNGIIFEKNEQFFGILTTKDILNATVSENFSNKSLYEFINNNPLIISDPDELIINKIEMLKEYRLFKLIPVIEDNKCLGILDNSLLIESK